MDFLDPKKARRSQIILLVGYCLVALLIGIVAIILVAWAYGWGLDKRGNVTQKGLVFISSNPTGAQVYLDNELYKPKTNTRANLLTGVHDIKLSKTGYRDWGHKVVVEGSDLQRYDYAWLIPKQLRPASVFTFEQNPLLVTQSPDGRWLLAIDSATPGQLTELDLRNPKDIKTQQLTLPDDSYTPGDGAQTWTLVEWSSDNKHVLLRHTYTMTGSLHYEYVLVDRDTLVDSSNLTRALKLDESTVLTLFDKKIEQFYAYQPAAKVLQRLTSSTGEATLSLENILAYKSYGDDKLVYVTTKSPTGKATSGVSAVLLDGEKTVTLRTLAADSPLYLLDIARYGGSQYVVVGASAEKRVYFYKDPQSQTIAKGDTYPDPWGRASVAGATFVEFSSSARYILVQNAQVFAVQDLDTDRHPRNAQYRYVASEVLDQPQGHATWVSGSQLSYVSGGKQLLFDLDYRNRQTLVAADPAFGPFFAKGTEYILTVRQESAQSKAALTITPLRVSPR